MTDTTERRLTPSERTHQLALALATRRSYPLSKVELILNAKGDVQIAVDVTDPDPAKAAQQAADLFDVLRDKYPRPEPTDAEEQAKKMGTAARVHAARARNASAPRENGATT